MEVGIKKKTFENEVTETSQVIATNDHTLYAKWTGTGIILPTPIKTGYIFMGWYDALNGGNKIGAGGEKYIPTMNKTLYAQWRLNNYTVSYNANGGNGSMPTDSVEYNSTYAIRENAFTREGYSFEGWNESSDGTGEDWTNNIGKTITWTYTKNITLYAIWNSKPVVTYEYNGATGGNEEKEKQVIYGTTYGNLPNPNKTITITYEYNGATGGNTNTSSIGTYTFGGWYKESNYQTQVTENTQVTEKANHTLYAKWTGGGIVLPTPTKTGYTFEYWCSDSGLVNKVGEGGITYNPTSNMTLYAKWKELSKYTITYNKNTTSTVSNMPANQTKTQGISIKLSSTVPSRSGYTFQGWSVNSAQTGSGEYSPGSTYSKDANITLYAVWKINGISASEIANNATSYYGKVVGNYRAPYDVTGSNTWRIFMSDGYNIYLISDDYMHYNYAPTKNGVAPNKISDYKLSFLKLTNQYSGAANISSSLGSKWLSTYWRSYSNSTNPNMKDVAYMLDTGIWNGKYKTGYDSIVDYAIGGPTIEMYCKSYRDTHPSKYIECGKVFSNGYSLKWSDQAEEEYTWFLRGIAQDEYNGIYIKSSRTKVDNMWISAPATSTGRVLHLLATRYSGELTDPDETDRSSGFRPIVCLKAGTQLERSVSTGNYRMLQE